MTQLLAWSAIVVALSASVAAAQPVPRSGQVAAGGEFGVFFPADARLSPGITAGGLLEVYATPRVGVRGSLHTIRTGYDRRDDDDERQLRLGLDLIYNWERGAVHPFLGAGVAMHFLRFHRGGANEGPNDTNFGTQVLGGVELFMNRQWTTKIEGRYQWVADRPNLNPDGAAVTIGLKRYF